MSSIPIAVRSSEGIYIAQGAPIFEENCLSLTDGKSGRSLFDATGTYFVYTLNLTIRVVRCADWQEIVRIESKSNVLAFSPKGTFLLTWEPFTVSNASPLGSPNLKIYETASGKLVTTITQKSQVSWEPQWSPDETLCSRFVNKDVLFYENANFDETVHRLKGLSLTSYSLSPLTGMSYLICFVVGTKGQPARGIMYKYPNFEQGQAVSSKSFFQADKIDYYWNKKGNYCLLMTMLDVDKSGSSYYGKQALYIYDITGKTAMVNLSKDGPIYNVAWSPKTSEFCVIYGFMPSKATLYNSQCEPIFELGTGPRNAINFNQFGNILLLGGFGNLRGNVETWDLSAKKLIGKIDTPDTIAVDWCPDGIHFITATTFPRLRVGNAYRIWHYSCTLLFEKLLSPNQELYDVKWQRLPKENFKEPTITQKKVEGIESALPQASKEVYRPPSARNRMVNFLLHEAVEEAHIPGSSASKAALKQRKKRETRKAKKADEEPTDKSEKPAVSSKIEVNLTGDPEKDKQIRNLKKKLDAIEVLKQQKAEGKVLESNQLSKITTEAELLTKLNELML